MSRDETDNTKSSSGTMDLFDQSRRTQFIQEQEQCGDQEQSYQNMSHQDESELLNPSKLGNKGSNKKESNKKDGLDSDSTSDFQNDVSFKNNTVVENGKFPPEARRALVSLLKHGVILAAQKGKLFDSICRYQSAVRSHLADVYLKLVLDEKTGVAFVAQLDEGEDDDSDAASLITRRVLSLYDTLLLLVLRKHYQERESSGEQRIIIDIERIEANLSPFLPLTNSMKSDRRKLIAALKKMSEKRILSMVRGSEDRFEITPIIRYVVNAAFLEQMLEEYQGLAREAELSMNLQGDNQEEGGTGGQKGGRE